MHLVCCCQDVLQTTSYQHVLHSISLSHAFCGFNYDVSAGKATWWQHKRLNASGISSTCSFMMKFYLPMMTTYYHCMSCIWNVDLKLKVLASWLDPTEFLSHSLCIPISMFVNNFYCFCLNPIQERTKNAQFIIISLRNNMFELADRLVGIYKTDNCTKSVTIDPYKLSQGIRPSIATEA